MRSRAWLVGVLFLLVSTPLAMASEALLPSSPSLVNGDDLGKQIEPSLTEQERLELASDHWHLLPEAQKVLVDLKPSTGIIHFASGSFDPLLGDGPEVGQEWMRKNDASFTGMAILQLEEANGVLLNQLSEHHNFAVLDVLHDEAWLIRLDGATTSFDALEAEEGVRWVGHQQPGWRVEPSLLQQPAGTPVFNVVPTPDLALGGYGTLATDIVRYGATEATCDAWMCSAAVEPQHARTLLHHLAHDGRVLWIEPAFELRVHNTLAWSIAGVQNVANNATFTLNGSGEMIAIADTGIDQNHPDLVGRVSPKTQFGLDPSAADSNTGHGTHIAVTVLGNGTGDTDARGVAPAATLVMYALEHDPTGVFGRIGSIYDMLRDAEQMTARLSVNAWGLNGNYGQYTADARSVDIFVHDRKDLTPVFSVGDNGGQ
ncbi:MAG: hypothetical protein CMA86_05385, partial [Euryarchaeota archaeon]|nr:hypothetical protein [Euryarchaeota archaeon]